MISTDAERTAASTLSGVAALCIAAALVRDIPQVVGVGLLVSSTALLILAIAFRDPKRGGWLRSDATNRLIGVAFVGFGLIATVIGVLQVVPPADGISWVLIGASLAAVAVATPVLLFASDRRSLAAFVVYLFSYGMLMFFVLLATGPTFVEVFQVDVTYFQVEGAHELLVGQNPYAVKFPQLHGIGAAIPIYGDSVVVDGVLQFGFPYLPLSLLLTAPVQWLFGDFRVVYLVAVPVTGWLIGAAGGTPRSRIFGAGFISAGPLIVMATVGWTEPLLAAAAAAIVFAHIRRPRLRPWMAGVFLALKQYTPLIAPAYLLLLGRPFRLRPVLVDAGKALLVLAASVVPFLLWNPEAFLRSTVFLQLRQPSRPDSLSLVAYVSRSTALPIWVAVAIPLVGVVAALAYGLAKASDDAQGFSLTAALTLSAWLLLGRQAFPNYYVLVLVFAVLAAALPGPVQELEAEGEASEPVPSSLRSR